MGVFEVRGGRINRRHLERKSKFDLCGMYLDLLDQFEKVQARARIAEQREAELVEALRDAATSLETIAQRRGFESHDDFVANVRPYAASRELVARAILAKHES